MTHPFGPRRPEPPAAVSDVERLLAYEEIRQLAARYALAVDSRDLDALVELFVDDVRATREAKGRDALRRFFSDALRADPVSILTIGTHVINLVDRDHAFGTVYCTCEIGDEGRWVRQAIAYEDTYERRDGQWYFVRRNHLLFYGVELPGRPLAQPEARWPARQVGRGSVPWDWATWQEFQATKGGA